MKRSSQKVRRGEAAGPSDEGVACARLHLTLGWWSLLGFLSLGVVLEGLHAFKSGWYLDVGNEARRLMFTLAHAHGTLLSLVNIAFGLCSYLLPGWPEGRRTLASRSLLAGTLLLPLGFLLGGVYVYEGDPGLGVWLVPAGALLLVVAVALAASGISRSLAAARSSGAPKGDRKG